MTPTRAAALAWQPESTRQVVKGCLTVRLTTPRDHVPTHRAFIEGRADAAPGVDDGPVDTIVRRHSHHLLVTGAYCSAHNAGHPEQGHREWDSLEDEIGLSRTFRLRFDPTAPLLALLESLRSLGSVEMVSPDYLVETPFSFDAVPLGHRGPDPFERVGAARALAIEPGDPSLIVGVIDSGAALGHPELAGRLRPGADLVDLGQEGLSTGLHLVGDVSGRDRTPLDEQGHGTATAGLLGARGLQVPRGIAGMARILPMRALAAALSPGRKEPTAMGAIPDIDAAVKLAVDLGARVLNLSFGTPASALRSEDPIPHTEVVEYALARGCVLVAASGNAGDDVAYYPAALPGVIAVGSVDADGRPSSFSSRGEHVALCAPGRSIPSLALEGYRRSTGTSFAAPFVAGAAALLIARGARSAAPLNGADVRRLLTSTARPFASADAPRGCGVGVLDIPAALTALDAELDSRAVA